jgi:hypothetical protein
VSEPLGDLVEQGREPPPGPPPAGRPELRAARWLAAHGVTRQRAGVVLGAVVLVVGGVLYAGRPTLPPPDGASSAPVAESSRLAPVPARQIPEGLTPNAHDLSLPVDSEHDSFIASAGHVLLFLQVRNDSRIPLRVVAGMVPQDGVSVDLTAGGLSAGTNPNLPLAPGGTSEVFVRLAVDCQAAVVGPPATQLRLAVEPTDGSAQARYEGISLTSTGSLWDEARSAACAAFTPAQAVSVRIVPGTLRGHQARTGERTVSGKLEIHDRAGFAAALIRLADPLAAGATLFWVPADDPIVYVDGGATITTSVDWRIDDCTGAAKLPPAAPVFAVRLPNGASTPVAADTGFGSYPRAWAAALQAACGSGHA